MDNEKSFRFVDVRKMITNYVNNEIGEPSQDRDSKYKRSTGITVVKEGKVSMVVSRGIAIKRIMTSMSSDLSKIDNLLKKIGLNKIKELNDAGANIKSIRFASTNEDLSVLVSVKNSTTDNKNANPVKKLLGDKKFSKVFEEKTTWTLNDALVAQCITALSGTFGKSFIDKAVSVKKTYSIKSKEELDKLMCEDLDPATRSTLDNFIKPAEIAITYPK